MPDAAPFNALLRDQLAFHWTTQLRPRLKGLSDEEYFFEPAPGAWSVRPRGAAATPMAAGDGAMEIDFDFPEPDPAPFTTIAWRLGHVIVGVLAMRNAAHFGGPAVDYNTFAYAATATEALAQLDAEYDRWQEGVASLGEEGLQRPVGPAEGPWSSASCAELVLHINRECIHHLAEVCLLRDLYLHTH